MESKDDIDKLVQDFIKRGEAVLNPNQPPPATGLHRLQRMHACIQHYAGNRTALVYVGAGGMMLIAVVSIVVSVIY